MSRIPVGVLGATGAVGQRFVALLADHPWFELAALAASERSIGQPYAEACHWLLPMPMPTAVQDVIVQPLEPALDCRVVFSALPAQVAGPTEERFARAGYIVCTNASAHRMDADVPLLIPEVNHSHTVLIETQQRERGWKGCIVASANCSATALTLALKPLHDGFGLRKLSVTTLQAISGAGYPGVPALDILGNVVPFIDGEEGKLEQEPRKMLGGLHNGRVTDAPFTVSAQCNRVPVRDGHTECVSLACARGPSADEAIAALEAFCSPAETVNLPSTPRHPLVVRREPNRPQPIHDRDTGHGMTVVVGRVRPCALFDVKFVLLGHNTVRGAAGGAIHNAELLVSQGWTS